MTSLLSWYLLTVRQTDKQTQANAFSSSFVGGNKVWTVSCMQATAELLLQLVLGCF